MGAGIAVVMLNAGLQVTLVERDALSLEGGLARIGGLFPAPDRENAADARRSAEPAGATAGDA
ncbi:hypothetical protein JNO12_10615 [Erwinia aphidicola]|nr:hypothetical protein [Erwinia aphidicola]